MKLDHYSGYSLESVKAESKKNIWYAGAEM